MSRSSKKVVSRKKLLAKKQRRKTVKKKRASRPTDLLWVYLTASNREEATKIGEGLVLRKFAACVNILPEMSSIYWWKSKVEYSQEAVLIAKTDVAHFDQLLEWVKKNHTYTVPCVLSFRVEAGNPDYLQWLNENLE